MLVGIGHDVPTISQSSMTVRNDTLVQRIVHSYCSLSSQGIAVINVRADDSPSMLAAPICCIHPLLQAA